MATKRTSEGQKSVRRSSGGKSRSAAQRRSVSSSRPDRNLAEPVAARALQSLILAVGVSLLLGALFGWRAGLGLVGGLVLASAFPPLRRHVDRWLVGKSRGDEANQAAVIRMAIGILILLIVLVSMFQQ